MLLIALSQKGWFQYSNNFTEKRVQIEHPRPTRNWTETFLKNSIFVVTKDQELLSTYVYYEFWNSTFGTNSVYLQLLI